VERKEGDVKTSRSEVRSRAHLDGLIELQGRGREGN